MTLKWPLACFRALKAPCHDKNAILPARQSPEQPEGHNARAHRDVPPVLRQQFLQRSRTRHYFQHLKPAVSKDRSPSAMSKLEYVGVRVDTDIEVPAGLYPAAEEQHVVVDAFLRGCLDDQHTAGSQRTHHVVEKASGMIHVFHHVECSNDIERPIGYSFVERTKFDESWCSAVGALNRCLRKV